MKTIILMLFVFYGVCFCNDIDMFLLSQDINLIRIDVFEATKKHMTEDPWNHSEDNPIAKPFIDNGMYNTVFFISSGITAGISLSKLPKSIKRIYLISLGLAEVYCIASWKTSDAKFEYAYKF